MGDVSAEPSMEEILSSIKRIIAEEGDATATRQRRQPRAASTVPPPPPAPVEAYDDDPDAVLELNDPVPAPPPEPARVAPEPVRTAAPAAIDPAILSRQTADATRGSLETLSRLIVKPEADSDGTLEGLVREMLRPMLRDWLDANLPPLVETMVAREIAKITAQH